MLGFFQWQGQENIRHIRKMSEEISLHKYFSLWITLLYCRNLFFRFSFFTSMGIKLVFVMEGEAPRLKADTMSKRNEMRYGPSKKSGAVRTGRSLFKAMLKEVSN